MTTTAYAGKDMILKMDISGTKETIGGFRSNGFTINGETIDVTNKGSNGRRELLDGGGIKSMSVSGSGIFTDDGYISDVQTAVLDGTLQDCDLVVPGFGTYSAQFAITSLEMSGEHNGEVTYSISLESSGDIDFA